MRDAAPVRLEVPRRGDEVHAVRDEQAWPPIGTRWTPLYLAPAELREGPIDSSASVRFVAPRGGVQFTWQVPDDLELVGPMKLKLHVELSGGTDSHLFVAVRKFEGGRHVPFEASYGFGRDVVTKGWMRVAHRRLDESRSHPYRPFHPCNVAEPLREGEIAAVEIELLPSATFFRRGETLRLDVQGHWFWRRSALFGMFPSSYAPRPPGTVVLHLGGRCDSHLLIPGRGGKARVG
jgi:putative CocE/NonD family hydrolase